MESNSSSFNCFCKEKLDTTDEEMLIYHVQNCYEYKKNAPFGQVFAGSNFKKMSLAGLRVFKAELQSYKYIIEQELFQKECGNTLTTSMSKTNSGDFITTECCKKMFPFSEMEKLIILDSCSHTLCRNCLNSYIIKQLKDNKEALCFVSRCGKPISEFEAKYVVGNDLYESLVLKNLESVSNFVVCVKCKNTFDFLIGSVYQKMTDRNGNPMSKEAILDFSENRFVCPNCHEEQCRKCKAVPYHMGHTCASLLEKSHSMICRFCEKTISKKDITMPLTLQLICESDECIIKASKCCTKELKCGHPCCGVLDEVNCLPCLNSDCESISKIQQKGSDYCTICYVESLVNGPCIQSECGHIFHYECISKVLDERWQKARISFKFCTCPLCNIWLKYPPTSILQQKVHVYQQLLEKISGMAMSRLKHEERLKDQRLITQGDIYYQKPLEYALAIYSYYECFKCKSPYFGGLKSCENAQDNGGAEKFNPAELVCAKCCDIPIETCKTHGNDFIEFKCKFCCDVAQWFCWGTTHFCESCHKRQCNGDYLSKYDVSKLPLCQGPQKCPLGGHHKPNGQESSLGCSLCRNIKDNVLNF